MPCLKFLGRKWLLAGDDLAVPAGVDAAVSCSWLATLGYFLRHHGAALWNSGWYPRALFGGGALLLGAKIVNQLALVHISLKGTVVNSWPRRHIQSVLWIKTCLDGLQLAFIVYLGAKWATVDAMKMPAELVTAISTLLKAGWAYLFVSGMSILLIFKRKPSSDKPVKTDHPDLLRSDSYSSVITDKWNERMGFVWKMLNTDDSYQMQRITELLVSFEKNDASADLAPSDVVASLLLIERQQYARRQGLWAALRRTGPGAVGRPVQPRPWMTRPAAAHYMRFAAGAYGWPMYVFRTLLSSLNLASYMYRNRNSSSDLCVVGDSPNLINTKVVKLVTGLTDEDIVFVSFYNKLCVIPFYVARDHSSRSIVVSIRGTLSLEDVITDITAYDTEPVPLGGAPAARVHSGMYDTARFILTLLTRGGAAERLPEFHHVTPILQKAYDGDYADYQLVVTGHSLGAGVAALVTLMLRDTPEYGSARCFAFSPPGGLVDVETARRAEGCVCSVVLGDDIVGRLSLTNLYAIKIRLLKTLRDCDVPKHEIYGGWLRHLLDRLLGSGAHSHVPRERRSWQQDAHAQAEVRRFQRAVNTVIDNNERDKVKLTDLYMPGCVMYVKETLTRRWLRRQRQVEVFYSGGDSELFDEILLSPDMIRQHMPWEVLTALEH